MEETTIRISKEAHNFLNTMKVHKNQSNAEVLDRLIKEFVDLQNDR